MNVKGLSFIVTFLLLGTTLWSASTSLPEDPENFHIFLLMGQSNMEGGSSIDGDMDLQPHPRILKLNSWGSWQIATDPITNNKTPAVGPAFSFAKKLVEEDESITVGLVPLAVGGTAIADWMRGSSLYQATLHDAAVARINGTIKGILWHQGEHDSFVEWNATNYAIHLKRLINDLRIDLNAPHLPFIIGGFTNSNYSNNIVRHNPRVWKRLKLVGTTFYQAGYVRSSGAPYYPYYTDQIHFTTEGQRIMGARYCEEYLRVSGHWQSKLKEELDSTSTTIDESGWKWNPSLGMYFDKNYPFIKHAQLGWLYLDGYADGTMRIESATNGTFRTLLDDNEQGLYIYRPNEDPEIAEPDTTYYVWLYANENSAIVFYNHSTGTWSKTIDNVPVLDSYEAIYQKATEELTEAQAAYQSLISSIEQTPFDWSEITQTLKNMERNRMYTILYALEAYQMAASDAEQENRTVSLNQITTLTHQVDGLFIQAQHDWQTYSEALLSGAYQQ